VVRPCRKPRHKLIFPGATRSAAAHLSSPGIQALQDDIALGLKVRFVFDVIERYQVERSEAGPLFSKIPPRISRAVSLSGSRQAARFRRPPLSFRQQPRVETTRTISHLDVPPSRSPRECFPVNFGAGP